MYSKIKGSSQVTAILLSKIALVNFTLGLEEAGEGVAAHFCQNSIDKYPNYIWGKLGSCILQFVFEQIAFFQCKNLTTKQSRVSMFILRWSKSYQDYLELPDP